MTLLAFGNGAPDVFSALSAVQNMKNDDVGLVMGALLGIIYTVAIVQLFYHLEFLCILFAFTAVTFGWASQRSLLLYLYHSSSLQILPWQLFRTSHHQINLEIGCPLNNYDL